MHDHLERRGRPRVELFLVVALSGLAGFLVSYTLLTIGLTSMPARYALAGVGAYLAFLCGIRVWIAWKQGAAADIDGLDVLHPDFSSPLRWRGSGGELFQGGRSGGGGASDSWASRGGEAHKSGATGGWLDGDVDLGWVLLVVVVALAGAAAVGYVVFLAPVLLAEVLVDAVIVAAISRRVGHIEKRDWTATVLRCTWVPALALILSVTVAGWALQQAAPGARSLGPAVAQALGR